MSVLLIVLAVCLIALIAYILAVNSRQSVIAHDLFEATYIALAFAVAFEQALTQYGGIVLGVLALIGVIGYALSAHARAQEICRLLLMWSVAAAATGMLFGHAHPRF